MAVVRKQPPWSARPEVALAYWLDKGRYPGEVVASLAALLYGGGPFEALRSEQLRELGFMLECAVRGKVSKRSLAAWLTQLASRDDRQAAVEALRARLVEKASEVELVGRREAA